MGLRIVSSTSRTLTLTSLPTLLLTLRRSSTTHSLEGSPKKERQLEIRHKIISKSGYDQVFHSDDGDNYSDYNTIKENAEMRIK